MPVCLNHLSQVEDTPVEPISMGGKRDTAKRDIQGAIPKVELASGLRRPRTTWASPCLLQSGCWVPGRDSNWHRLAPENLPGGLGPEYQQTRFKQYQSKIQRVPQIAHPKGNRSRHQNLGRQTTSIVMNLSFYSFPYFFLLYFFFLDFLSFHFAFISHTFILFYSLFSFNCSFIFFFLFPFSILYFTLFITTTF